MKIFRHLPRPSDRMGIIGTLGTIKDAAILEFGPQGDMHYLLGQFDALNSQVSAEFYTSDMDEDTIIMGYTDRLENAIYELDKKENIKYIFVVDSTSSAIIGTDIRGICRECSNNTNSKIICFDDINMNDDYTAGIEKVLSTLANECIIDFKEKKPKTYNIIGCNIDSFNYAADLEEIKRMMSEIFGYSVNTIFTADTSIDSIERAGTAEFNLVLRQEGIKCAQIMKEKFGIDYLYGIPIGKKGTLNWIKNIENKFSLKADKSVIVSECEIIQKEFDYFTYKQMMQRSRKTVVSGNYDFLVNSYDYFVKELNLNIDKMLVNHKQNGEVEEKLKDIIIFDEDENVRDKEISSIDPDFILGDGILVDKYASKCKCLQISNPNLRKKMRYKYTPYVGFRGAVFLTCELNNLMSL